MIPQGVAAVLGAVRSTFLQQWHDLVDEVVQTLRGQVRHQDESVAGVRLDIPVDLVGDVGGGADELLAAGDGDDQLTDRQLFGLSAFAEAAGHRDRVAVPNATPGDAGIARRIDVRERPVGVVFREVTAPDLFEHGDRRGAADLLVTNMYRFLGGLFSGVGKHESGGRKNLELVGVSPVGGRATLDVGVIALAIF